jgi:uncharacterized protein YjbJ (UPF0337 family)
VLLEGRPEVVRSLTTTRRSSMSDGKMDEGKGRLKEAAGDLTDDRDLKNEGKVDKASGKVKGAVGDVADKLKGK